MWIRMFGTIFKFKLLKDYCWNAIAYWNVKVLSKQVHVHDVHLLGKARQ